MSPEEASVITWTIEVVTKLEGREAGIRLVDTLACNFTGKDGSESFKQTAYKYVDAMVEAAATAAAAAAATTEAGRQHVESGPEKHLGDGQ